MAELEGKAQSGMQVFNAADMEHRRSANFSRVYTNSANFGINFFDLSIAFGEMVALGDSAHIEDLVVVTMSLEHARALTNALEQTLAHYEKTHGHVRNAPAKSD